MNPLHENIRRLPVGVEFLIVVSWAFGLPIFSSIMALGDEQASREPEVLSNSLLFSVLIFELVQSAFLIWFLRVRGWTLEKFGLQFNWSGTAVGVVLAALTYLLIIGAEYLAQALLPVDMKAINPDPKADPTLSMQLVFFSSTVNGMFEELFVAGYIITALKDVRGMWTAINVSTTVRLLYHLYQGPIGVITIVPIGLLYGYVYARTRLLWPLILANVLTDIVAMSLLMASK